MALLTLAVKTISTVSNLANTVVASFVIKAFSKVMTVVHVLCTFVDICRKETQFIVICHNHLST